MPSGRMIVACRGAFAAGVGIFAALPLGISAATAQSEQVIYSFPSDYAPMARPYENSTGTLYVPAYTGSAYGTMTQLSEKHGKWSGRAIYQFKGSLGEFPVAGVIADPNGVLYGTTSEGGIHGFGNVYSLTLSNGAWTESVIYDFRGSPGGGKPTTNLARDKSTGALYGTTSSGGSTIGCGTAFSLSPSGKTWNFHVLHGFGVGSDGCNPSTALHPGPKKGTYFGVTATGGTESAGTVYELTEKNGAWTESVIYSFTGANDGKTPSDLDVDPDTGILYGVTSSGGTDGAGVVFELSETDSQWVQSVLYSFSGSTDGNDPVGLHEEKNTGTLYGTTESGGEFRDGTVFELVKIGSNWTETVLHSFGSSRNDGTFPQSRPNEDPVTSYLYGTTESGGKHGGGTVYEIIP